MAYKRRFHADEIPCQGDQPVTPPSLNPAEQLFNKRFQYNPGPDWTAEVFSPELAHKRRGSPNIFMQKAMETLDEFKAGLNSLKDKLSDKDIVQWHEHTNFTNLAGGIIQACKQRFRPELCTQAWCKFYEIVSAYPLIPLHEESLVTAHLCEAPGAFVTSLNHYLASQDFQGNWQWRATTLNPYYEGNSLGYMIDDDRFLRHSLEFWEFGVDNTGDLFNSENQDSLKSKMEELGSVHLVTADGSIDCQNMPAEQERVVSPLHYCEVVTAFQLLSEGGSFVIKLFTMFEYNTVCLMYILNCAFKQVHVFKPATSKSGNSEVYVVCLQYRGTEALTSDLWEFLRSRKGNVTSSDSAGVPNSQTDLKLSDSFMLQHIECCQKFMTYQGETIQANLNFFETMTEELKAEIQFLKNYCTEMYIERYQLQQICFYAKVGRYPKKKSKDGHCAWMKAVYQKDPCPRKKAGTFKERHNLSQIPWQQRLKSFQTHELPLMTDFNDHFIGHGEATLVNLEGISVTRGRPVSKIQSSRFCDNALLSEFQDVIRHSMIQTHRLKLEKNLLHRSSGSLEMILKSLFPNFPDYELNVFDLTQQQSPCLLAIKEKYEGSKLQIFSSPVQGVEPDLLYIDLTFAGDSEELGMEEVKIQHKLALNIAHVFSTLPCGSTVIFHLYTALTRYTAGLFYILFHCFHRVALEPVCSLLLDQFLVCQGYEGCTNWCLEHLKMCGQLEESEQASQPLEVLPITEILSCDPFVSFLKASNDRTIQAFINWTIVKEKEAYGLQENVT